MVVTFKDYGLAVAEAMGAVVARASRPSPRVAQHWLSTSQLTWFGACADHHVIQASWSFGQLREPLLREPGQRATVGAFVVNQAAFPEVREQQVRALCEGLVPAGTDGATRVFLMRVASQFAVADFLLTLPELLGCDVSLFLRPDVLDKPAPTPRWPAHARDRVAAALAAMDPALAARCERVWTAEAPALLDALRSPSR